MREIWDEVTGLRYIQTDDGDLIPAPEAGLLAQAGRQFADLGSGIKYAYGDITDQPELMASATAETEERNRLFRGTDLADPVTSAVGQALPGLATAPLGGLGTGLVLGAGESALDLGEGGTMAQRAAAGGAGALLGEFGGHVLGRVAKMARGLMDDFVGIRRVADNPKAAAYEALGGSTLAYQRMADEAPGRGFAENAVAGAEASLVPTNVLKETFAANDKLHRDSLVEAVGLEPGKYDVLGQDFVSDALDRFNEGFQEVAKTAGERGTFDLSPAIGKKLASLPEIKELIDLDDFQGLVRAKDAPDNWYPTITGDEWMDAREALSEAAANRFANGRSPAGRKLLAMVDALDADMRRHVPEEFLPEYARLREQYRVFSIAEKGRSISNDGQVNVATLRNNLDSKASGFGRTATGGGETVNPETRKLIDLMQAADNPEFKALRSSGTAERQMLAQESSNAVEAGAALMAGDALPAAGFAARMMGPTVVGRTQMGSGNVYKAAFEPAPYQAVLAGRAAGRSMLDEYLYPLVGVRDETQQ